MTAAPHRRAAAVLAPVVLAAVTFAGCSSSDDVAEEGNEYCDARLEFETAGEPDIDADVLTEDQQVAEAKQFASESLRPIADRLVAAAPAELAGDIAVLSDAVREVEETGRLDVFETVEAKDARGRVHGFDLQACGWSADAVSATEYMFEGLPAILVGDAFSFEFSNAGQELHEMVLFRKEAGTSERIQDLVSLPEEELRTKLTFVASTSAPPGDRDYVVANLEAGQYGIVCFVPVGATSEEAAEDSTAPPHFTEGMFYELRSSSARNPHQGGRKRREAYARQRIRTYGKSATR